MSSMQLDECVSGAAWLLSQEFCEDCETRYRTVRRDPGLSNNRELPGAFQAGLHPQHAVHTLPGACKLCCMHICQSMAPLPADIADA
jgi:hypothetical protein